MQFSFKKDVNLLHYELLKATHHNQHESNNLWTIFLILKIGKKISFHLI